MTARSDLPHPDIERRMFSSTDLRVARSAQGMRIEGHAALFDSRSDDLGGFVEEIAPGAFHDAIPRSDVRALWNHNPDYVLGRTRSGTLTIREDARGLWFSNQVPDTQWARDLMVSIQRGDVSQMSFAFRIETGGDQWRREGKTQIRRIVRFSQLYDVSPVTYPAYRETSVSQRERAARGHAGGGQADLNRRKLQLLLLDSGTTAPRHNVPRWRQQLDHLERRLELLTL